MGASKSGHTDVGQLLLSSGSKVDPQNKVRHHINFIQARSKSGGLSKDVLVYTTHIYVIDNAWYSEIYSQ